MRFWVMLLAVVMTFFGPQAEAQQASAEKIGLMLITNLSPTGAMESGKWFTDPPIATPGALGLGIIYVYIPDSAGSVSIHAGIFRQDPTGWSLNHEVTGLFGMSPTNAVFYDDRIEVTTTTLGPNDPRCCPSVATRWSIDVSNGVARRRD